MIVSRRAALIGAMGTATAAVAPFVPSVGYGKPRPIDLEGAIPDRFGTWTRDPDARPVLPDEAAERSVAHSYDAWIGRVYRDAASGANVMFVLAYGNAQSRTIAIHRPETCYSAQGFSVRALPAIPLAGVLRPVTGSRLVARREGRIEPVLFWMTIAGRQSDFGIAQSVALVRAAWRDEPADGFLIRASMVSDDIAGSTATIEAFLASMAASLSPAMRRSLGIAS